MLDLLLCIQVLLLLLYSTVVSLHPNDFFFPFQTLDAQIQKRDGAPEQYGGVSQLPSSRTNAGKPHRTVVPSRCEESWRVSDPSTGTAIWRRRRLPRKLAQSVGVEI